MYQVWRQVAKAREIDQVWVATDNDEIARAAEVFGAQVVVTSRKPRTGSDRVAEALAELAGDIVINVQADCVGLKAAALNRVIRAMKRDRSVQFATLVRSIKDDRELFDPGVVKVVVDRTDRALWFSRYPLPYLQRAGTGPRSRQFGYLAHIGVYFFRRAALKAYARWNQTKLEKAESLEQLRILENGGAMRVFRTAARIISIDKPEDLKKISGR